MKKRLLSAALVLCLLLALLPMAAFADDDVQTGTCGDGLTWTLDAAGTLTVTGSGVISANAFAFNSKIVRAEIGAGVTGIGLGAFFKCANLEAVTLPAGLTTLGTAAFAYCEKLASVTLPGSLKSTGDWAFQGCTALTAVTILPGVTRIDTRAFSDCAALKEITIPASVTAIGGSAFSGCLALRTVHFGGSKEAWQAVEVGEHNTLLRLAKVDYNAVTEHHFGDWTVTTEATCTEPGVRTRTCTDPGCAETETESIPALGHDWGEWVTSIEPTVSTVGYRYHVCNRDGCGYREGEDIPKLQEHTWDSGIVTTKPDCIHAGVRTYTCTDCGATKTETIPATGEHTFVTKEIPATCTTGGYIQCTCSVCGTTQRYDASEPLGHKWNSGQVTTKPTEDMAGVRTYTCTVCGDTKTETIPATGVHVHTWQLTKHVPAACTEDGYDLYTCAKCGAVEHRNEVAAFGHKMNAGEVVIKPTATTSGVRVYTCSVCGETKAETIPATGLPSVCPGGPACPGYAFRDMPAPSIWSHAGLDYCVYHGYIAGTSATTVTPDGECTRAMIVSILYRVQGEPAKVNDYELKKLAPPFDDVERGCWYTDAIWWAKLTGVVSGMSPSTFAPDDPITRAQLAVILYNYTKQFAPESLTETGSLTGFPDADSVPSWARTAMAWAVGNGLISGVGENGVSYLRPEGCATRAQVATILMNYDKALG